MPEVGKGATIVSWTDRHAYEVLEVKNRGREVVIQRYKRERADDIPMSNNWKHEVLEGEPMTLYYKWGAWRVKTFDGWSKLSIVFGIAESYHDYEF